MTPDRNLPEQLSQDPVIPGSEAPLAASAPQPATDSPPWNGMDVLVLVAVTIVSGFLFLAAAISLAAMLHVDGAGTHGESAVVLFTDVRVILPPQLLTYLVVFFFMIQIVQRRYGQRFLPALRWNWPARRWSSFVLVGVALAFVVSVLNNYLPETKNLPIDLLFQRRSAVFLLAGFGIFLAPFMEEFFFRGFLYPVLLRRMGLASAVILTAIAFMTIHISQLGGSWSPLLVIFGVGLVLTLVRALTGSVAASVLAHAGYNATLFLMLYFGTQGFHHFEPLTK